MARVDVTVVTREQRLRPMTRAPSSMRRIRAGRALRHLPRPPRCARSVSAQVPGAETLGDALCLHSPSRGVRGAPTSVGADRGGVAPHDRRRDRFGLGSTYACQADRFRARDGSVARRMDTDSSLPSPHASSHDLPPPVPLREPGGRDFVEAGRAAATIQRMAANVDVRDNPWRDPRRPTLGRC